MKNLKELVELIHLKRVDDQIFEGQSSDIGSASVFGGQVLAQSLNAAKRTVSEDRIVHSMHAYFLLPGDFNLPIQYRVESIRNGRSFATRRVVAYQKDQAIFNMAASFQIKEESPEFQQNIPKVFGPKGLENWEDIYKKIKSFIPKKSKNYFEIPKPIEFRPVEQVGLLTAQESPKRDVWMRFIDANKDELEQFNNYSHEVMAYASDYNLLATTIQPLENRSMANTMMASLDHSMWFHKSIDLVDWFLYHIETLNFSNSRGLSRGSIFNQNGNLLASVTQEGLVRKLKMNEHS